MAQLMLMMLLGSYVHGQESLERLKKRARPFEPIILAAAAKHDVDPRLLWTIAYLESRFNPQAISYKDGRPCAFGLMQFVPSTAKQYGLTNPHNSREAVDAAARYVRDLLKRFDGRGDLALAAYNAGEGTVEAFRDGQRLVLSGGKVINPNAIRTNGIPPYAETRSYVAHGRLVYDNIARQQLLSISRKSPGTAAVRKVEGSIYVSDFGTSTSPSATQVKGRESKQQTPARSLYVN
jgi:soluble lytic murein transglycosylase-like protein